jgi:hypothetical protein
VVFHKHERSTDLSSLYTILSAPRTSLTGSGSKSTRTESATKAFFALLLIAAAPAFSQTTTINLGTQGRNADFSNQPFTRPVTVGASLPSSCQLGQLFFNSSAPAGSNLYGCTAVNVWTALASASGSGSGSGQGGTGVASFTPTSLTFGNQVSGTGSAAQAVIVSNPGTASVSITGITVSGANAGDFSTSNNCGSSLGVGLSCTIAVSFTPSTTSAESAIVSVSDNATGSPQTIALSGTGTAVPSGSGPSVSPAVAAATVGSPLTLTANKSVTWSLAPGSAGSIASNGASAVYTPPASVAAQNTRAGCMVLPNDSVFNTRIDSLPVNSNSATWMNSFINPIVFLISWGTNIVDNTLPVTALFFHYTPNYNGNFQIAAMPNRKRETGSLTVDGNNDHHLVSVNRQSCQFYETYQDSMPYPPSVCAGCNAASGYQYSSTSYTQPTQGTTDAAGLPLAPLTLHLSELKAGSIKHAMRFTLCTGCINSAYYLWPATAGNGSNSPNAPPLGARFRLKASLVPSGLLSLNLTSSGSGYTSSPAVTVTGCRTAPVITAMVSGGSISSFAVNNPGSGCSQPTVTIGGPGTGATATATVFSPTAQVIVTALQQYGMILSDNGGSGQIEVDTDVFQDPKSANALWEVGNAKLGASYFEVVDESSLMISASSHRVNPANGYVTPASYASVIATDSQGNTTAVPVAIQPVIVGVPYTSMTIQAGMSGYQLQSWVNNSTNQNVIWTLTGPGTVTAGGLYTPPASVASQLSATLTATSSADPNASTNVYMNIIPAGANPSNSIRIDVGNTWGNYTDSHGNVWLPDTLGFESGGYSLQNDNYPTNGWGNAVDQGLFQTFYYTYGDDILYGPFIVPNGNYKVGFGFGEGGCIGTFSETTVYNNGLINGPVDLETQGQISSHFDLGKAVNYACRTPYTAYIPAKVTNNILYAAVRATGGSGSHSVPALNALSAVPDTTAPYLSIDTQLTTTTGAGSVIQVYAVGWYMSNAVTWSVSGGGSIDQNGVYTAPTTVPANGTVTITATSTANPSITATATLTITP